VNASPDDIHPDQRLPVLVPEQALTDDILGIEHEAWLFLSAIHYPFPFPTVA